MSIIAPGNLMKIYVDFPAKKALVQGVDVAGPRLIDIDVAVLTAAQRHVLSVITTDEEEKRPLKAYREEFQPADLYLNHAAVRDTSAEIPVPQSLDQASFIAWLDILAAAYAERQAREQAEAESIEAWVKQHGTQSMRDRQADGLL